MLHPCSPWCAHLVLLGTGAAAFMLAACSEASSGAPWAGDAHAGAGVIARKACGSCHEIPGISGADGAVGPSLANFGLRKLVAGRLANSRDNLQYYLLHPDEVVPGNYMPDQHLTAREARNVAAYLLSLQ